MNLIGKNSVPLYRETAQGAHALPVQRGIQAQVEKTINIVQKHLRICAIHDKYPRVAAETSIISLTVRCGIAHAEKNAVLLCILQQDFRLGRCQPILGIGGICSV
ncbi:hypothetical protein SDC9_75367 [bioreactor metagenome]|uniref:Uncharacterized protein n=1 Tax=bioreactor metagenome TaxID=1076179 RepID=A0A644YK19_9ZZZZ